MKRHARFVLAFVIGAVVALLVQLTPLPFELRVLAAANAFFVSYLGLMLQFAATTSSDELRTHAEQNDAGVIAILLLALAAGAISLTSIILVLSAPSRQHARAADRLGFGAAGLGCGACTGRVSLCLSVLPTPQGQDASRIGFPRHR